MKRISLVGATLLAVGVTPFTALAGTISHKNATTKTTKAAPTVVWETRAQFAHDLLTHFGIAADAHGKSNFTDMSTRNSSWGWVHKAMELGVLAPSHGRQYGTQITQTEAATAAAKLLKMSLGSMSPANWAKEQALFSGSQAKTYLTQADTKAFLARLDQLKKVVAKAPGSWTLTSAQLQTLASALTNSENATFMQQSQNDTQVSYATLTTRGKKAYPNSGVQDDITVQTTSTKGTVNGQSAFLSNVVFQDSADASQNGTAGEYIFGNQVFENDGSGWQQDSVSDAQSAMADAKQLFLPLSQLQNVTLSHQANGDVYTAHLNSNLLSSLADQIAESLPTTSNVTPAMVKAILGRLSVTDALTVSTVNGMPMITHEQVHISGNIPVSAIPMSSKDKVKVELEMTSLILDEKITGTYTYNQTDLTIPTGLPGAATTTSRDSSSTDSSSNTTSGATGTTTDASGTTGTSGTTATDSSGSTGATTTSGSATSAPATTGSSTSSTGNTGTTTPTSGQ